MYYIANRMNVTLHYFAQKRISTDENSIVNFFLEFRTPKLVTHAKVIPCIMLTRSTNQFQKYKSSIFTQ